jgi:hypothetical protein
MPMIGAKIVTNGFLVLTDLTKAENRLSFA